MCSHGENCRHCWADTIDRFFTQFDYEHEEVWL